MTDPVKHPHVPAAFINAIAEGGTKAEAVEWLQKLWNENCALRSQAESASNSDLTKLAAELHRSKWQFDLSEDYQPSKAAARGLIAKAFDELHRIGDMAMTMRDQSKPLRSPPKVSTVRPDEASIPVLVEALYHCGCPAGGMRVGDCAEQGVCGCSIRAERIKGCMGPEHQTFSREESNG